MTKLQEAGAEVFVAPNCNSRRRVNVCPRPGLRWLNNRRSREGPGARSQTRSRRARVRSSQAAAGAFTLPARCLHALSWLRTPYREHDIVFDQVHHRTAPANSSHWTATKSPCVSSALWWCALALTPQGCMSKVRLASAAGIVVWVSQLSWRAWVAARLAATRAG